MGDGQILNKKQINNDLKVAHPQSGSSSGLIPGRIGIWKYRFSRRAGNRGTRRKTSPSKRDGTNNKLNPHMASTPGFEPGPHW